MLLHRAMPLHRQRSAKRSTSRCRQASSCSQRRSRPARRSEGRRMNPRPGAVGSQLASFPSGATCDLCLGWRWRHDPRPSAWRGFHTADILLRAAPEHGIREIPDAWRENCPPCLRLRPTTAWTAGNSGVMNGPYLWDGPSSITPRGSIGTGPPLLGQHRRLVLGAPGARSTRVRRPPHRGRSQGDRLRCHGDRAAQ
jgi:hypothetical protein